LTTEDAFSFDKIIQMCVYPTYEKLVIFSKTGVLNSEQFHKTLRNIIAHTIQEGTRMTVITEQEKGLKGTVKEVLDQDTIQMEFTTNGQATLTMDIPKSYVRVSDYVVGDSVKVLQGEKLGVKGLVVNVTEGCVIVHDGKSKETV
jgi:hypothetical protein